MEDQLYFQRVENYTELWGIFRGIVENKPGKVNWSHYMKGFEFQPRIWPLTLVTKMKKMKKNKQIALESLLK